MTTETPEQLLAAIQALWRQAHPPGRRPGRGFRQPTAAQARAIETQIRRYADRFRALRHDTTVQVDYDDYHRRS